MDRDSLLSRISRPENSSSETARPAGSRDERFIEKTRAIILEHLGDHRFNVPALAGGLSLSVSQLNRRLNALLEQPAGQLIRDLRLSHAARLLSADAASVREIAAATGFKTQAHFCRSFKEKFGCPPSEFREQARQASG